MDIKGLLKKYLREARLMQLATVSEGKPWLSTVYFVADGDMNIYWLSLPGRRHSQELAKNPVAAIAIAVKDDKPVIGIQAQGEVELVKDASVVEEVMGPYIEKYRTGNDFLELFVARNNQHEMYRFSARNIILFDEVDFPDQPRQVIDLS